MNIKRSVICALIGATCLVSTAAMADECKPVHQFKTIKPGVITQAVVSYMPFDSVGPDGQPIGVDGDILRKIAAMECLDIHAISVDATAALNYVVSRRADVASGDYYRTEQRARVLALSDPLYIDQMAVISPEGYHTIAQLEGKRVGSIQGDLWVSDVKKIPGIQQGNRT